MNRKAWSWLALSLVLATPTRADRILLATGEVLEVTVLEWNETGMRVEIAPGGKRRFVPRREIDPGSWGGWLAARFIAQGNDAHRQGLLWDGKGVVSRADRCYEEAACAAQKALHALGALPVLPEPSPQSAPAGVRVEEALRLLFDACLSLGYLHSAEGNWREACAWTDEALRVDPTARYALKLREHISEHYIHRSALEQAFGLPLPPPGK